MGLFGSIAEVAANAAVLGWAEGGAGNISILLPYGYAEGPKNHSGCPALVALQSPAPFLANRAILITNSGSRMREIGAKPIRHFSIIRFDGKGGHYKIFNTGIGVPSSELTMHSLIHNEQLKRKVNKPFLIHTHTPFASMLADAFCLQAIPAMLMKAHTEMPWFFRGGIGSIPLLPPGGLKLAIAAAEAFGKADCAVISRHGAIASGISIFEAFDKLEAVEKAACSLITLAALGISPDANDWDNEFLPKD